MRKQETVSMVFPGSAAVAPLFVDFAPHMQISRIVVAPAAALPATATIKVGILKPAGDPTAIADYYIIASLTAGGTVEVAGGHLAVWGLSGGTGGTVLVTICGDRIGGK
jgi:hypothetical protein